MAKILIAEDEPDILYLVSLTLERAGHTVVAAENGKRAYDLALKELPDLVILDVRMPDLNGYEACRLMKAEPALQDIPVVFLSVRGAESIRDAFAAGASDYLLKPFSPQYLAQRVAQLLSKRNVR
jgi:CheY-like chemotaxis protein